MEEEAIKEAAYQARRDYQDEVGKNGMNDCIMLDAMKIQKGFELGAKWQAERMYSEGELIRFMQYIISNPDLSNTSSVSETTAKYYLEQFKKK